MLKDGDYVRLGEYELLVSVDKSTDFSTDDSAIVAYDGEAVSSAVKKSTANDLGADLDLSQLLEPSDRAPADSGVHPRNAYGQSVAPKNMAAGGERRPVRHALAHDDAAAQSGNAARCSACAPFARPGALRRRLRYRTCGFCRGAGVDPRSITSEARAGALQLAGQLVLRGAVLGLMDLNHGHNEFRKSLSAWRSHRPDAPETP